MYERQFDKVEEKENLNESAISKIQKDIDYVIANIKEHLQRKLSRMDEGDAEYVVSEYGEDFPMMMLTMYFDKDNVHPKIKKNVSKFRRSTLRYKLY